MVMMRRRRNRRSRRRSRTMMMIMTMITMMMTMMVTSTKMMVMMKLEERLHTGLALDCLSLSNVRQQNDHTGHGPKHSNYMAGVRLTRQTWAVEKTLHGMYSPPPIHSLRCQNSRSCSFKDVSRTLWDTAIHWLSPIPKIKVPDVSHGETTTGLICISYLLTVLVGNLVTEDGTRLKPPERMPYKG